MASCRKQFTQSCNAKKGQSPHKLSQSKNLCYPTFTKDLFLSVFPIQIKDTGKADRDEADPDEFFSIMESLGSGRMGQTHLARRRDFTKYPCTIVPRLNDEDIVVWTRMHAKFVDHVDAVRILEPFNIDTLKTSIFLCKLLFSFRSRFPDQDMKYHLICRYEKGQTAFCKRLQHVGKLSEPGVKFYAMELADALFYIHSFDIVFRRLCTCCLIIKANGHLLLSPYSTCKQNIDCSQPCNMLSSNCGEQFYASPEVVFGTEVHKPTDWWSYGVIVFRMLTGSLPFTGQTLGDLGKAITEVFPEIPSHVSPGGNAFIKQLLHKDPRRRLGIGRDGKTCIENHPFFSDMDWADMRSLSLEVDPPFKIKPYSETLGKQSKLETECKTK